MVLATPAPSSLVGGPSVSTRLHPLVGHRGMFDAKLTFMEPMVTIKYMYDMKPGAKDCRPITVRLLGRCGGAGVPAFSVHAIACH